MNVGEWKYFGGKFLVASGTCYANGHDEETNEIWTADNYRRFRQLEPNGNEVFYHNLHQYNHPIITDVIKPFMDRNYINRLQPVGDYIYLWFDGVNIGNGERHTSYDFRSDWGYARSSCIVRVNKSDLKNSLSKTELAGSYPAAVMNTIRSDLYGEEWATTYVSSTKLIILESSKLDLSRR